MWIATCFLSVILSFGIDNHLFQQAVLLRDAAPLPKSWKYLNAQRERDLASTFAVMGLHYLLDGVLSAGQQKTTSHHEWEMTQEQSF